MRLETTITLNCRTGRPLVTVFGDDSGVLAYLADADGTDLLLLSGKTRNDIAGRLEDIAGQVRNARTWPPVGSVCLQPAGDPVDGVTPLCEYETNHQGPCGLRGLSRLEAHADERKDEYEAAYRLDELERAAQGDTG